MSSERAASSECGMSDMTDMTGEQGASGTADMKGTRGPVGKRGAGGPVGKHSASNMAGAIGEQSVTSTLGNHSPRSTDRPSGERAACSSIDVTSTKRDRLRPYPKPQAPFNAEAALASLENKDLDGQIDALEDILDGLSAQLPSAGD